MPTPNCEELSNSASAKTSYFFSIFSFIYFLFLSFLLATSSCRFFLFFFSCFLFFFSKGFRIYDI